jgi:hypothetical protein
MLRVLFLLALLGGGAFYVSHLIERRRLERLAQWRSAFLTLARPPREHGPTFKDVVLRDHGVRLRVPRHWSEEYPDEAHALFRNPASAAHVLRVEHATVAPSPGGLRALLGRHAGAGATAFEELPGGRALLKELVTSKDGAQSVLAFRWLVALPHPSGEAGLATFALAVPETAIGDPLTWDEVAMIDQEIRACRLGEPGTATGE